jgi:cell division septation protein DedD
MAPTYYVIELSGRWLTILLVALALVMVLAFAFGYGAAWSVLTARQQPVGAFARTTPGPSGVLTEDITDEEVIGVVPTQQPTAKAQPTRKPTAARKETATPKPQPTVSAEADAADGGFWVQVVASSNRQAMERATRQMTELGFPPDHQQVTTSQVAGGKVLHKLRVGPFPDRESADRVVRRMRTSGFSDAWIVVP